eukprot:scaffold114142_cov45-Attheya_sp.AAC.2
MVQQLKKSREVINILISETSKYPEQPIPDMYVEDMGEAFLASFHQLPPEDQQRMKYIALCDQIEHFREKDRTLEEQIDNEDEILDDGTEHEELPHEIGVAAAKNNIETVFQWLGPAPIAKERLDARLSEKLSRSLLHEAEFEGHLALMFLLLQEGADVNPKSCYGLTPLDQACSLDNREDAARLLLEWEKLGNRKLAKLVQILSEDVGARYLDWNPVYLNGLACVAERYLPKQERYDVRVEWTNEVVSIKPSNLKRRDRTVKDPGFRYMFTGTYVSKGLCFRSGEEMKTYKDSQAQKGDAQGASRAAGSENNVVK